MALLQISEPDEVPAPKPRRRAIGIDLGTTNSLVATVRDDGIARSLRALSGRCSLRPGIRSGKASRACRRR